MAKGKYYSLEALRIKGVGVIKTFVAAEASTGKVLWSYTSNRSLATSPMAHDFDNRQYIAVAVGQIIITFAVLE